MHHFQHMCLSWATLCGWWNIKTKVYSKWTVAFGVFSSTVGPVAFDQALQALWTMHAGDGPPLPLPAPLHRPGQPCPLHLVHHPLLDLHVALPLQCLPLCLPSLCHFVVAGGPDGDDCCGLMGADLVPSELRLHRVGLESAAVPVHDDLQWLHHLLSAPEVPRRPSDRVREGDERGLLLAEPKASRHQSHCFRQRWCRGGVNVTDHAAVVWWFAVLGKADEHVWFTSLCPLAVSPVTDDAEMLQWFDSWVCQGKAHGCGFCPDELIAPCYQPQQSYEGQSQCKGGDESGLPLMKSRSPWWFDGVGGTDKWQVSCLTKSRSPWWFDGVGGTDKWQASCLEI